MAKKKKLPILDYLIVFLLGFAVVGVSYTAYKVFTDSKPVTPVAPIVTTVEKGKPTYEYLKSVSVYIFQYMETDADGVHGGVGSGTVIAEKNGEFYILTNKHVCDKENEGTCYVVPGGEKNGQKYLLTYVKSADDKHDLSIWKVNKNVLPEKRPIKGTGTVNIQDNVYSVGNYLGIPLIYTEGTMSGYDEYEGVKSPLFNMPCAFGCSGSGVFNSDGELVSVIVAGNGLPTSLPLIQSFDSTKPIGIEIDYVVKFVNSVEKSILYVNHKKHSFCEEAFEDACK